MKRLISLLMVFSLFASTTFAITQTVNEKDWINYGFIQKVYKKNFKYYVTVDYIQLYTWKEGLIASIEDWDCKISWYTKKQLTDIANKSSLDTNGIPTNKTFYTPSSSWGDCEFMYYPPYDYIRNTNKKLRTYKIDTSKKTFWYCANDKEWWASYGIVNFNNWYYGKPMNWNTPWEGFNPSKWKFYDTYYELILKKWIVTWIEQRACLP